MHSRPHSPRSRGRPGLGEQRWGRSAGSCRWGCVSHGGQRWTLIVPEGHSWLDNYQPVRGTRLINRKEDRGREHKQRSQQVQWNYAMNPKTPLGAGEGCRWRPPTPQTQEQVPLAGDGDSAGVAKDCGPGTVSLATW